MKIKLLAREIEIQKSDDLDGLAGLSDMDKNIVQYSGKDAFVSVMHELKHLYLYNTGYHQMPVIEEDIICEICAQFINQMMIENGPDIFKTIKENC